MRPFRVSFSQSVLILSTLAFSWLAFQCVHELGHVLVAWYTGAEFIQVHLHPFTISETELWTNPHPLVEVWAGPIVGCALPLAVWLVVRRLQLPLAPLSRFFAGACCVANGVYIAFGPGKNGADTAVMLEHGTPRWIMVTFGLPMVALGLALWHRQGPDFGLGESGGQVDRRLVIGSVVLLTFVLCFEAAFNLLY